MTRTKNFQPRPLLQYLGAKWRLAPWIISHFPAHRVYVEPFGGSAAVLLRKPLAAVEVYNDLDGEVVGLFRVLQNPDQLRRLLQLCRRTPVSRSIYMEAFDQSDDPVVRAWRLIVCSHWGLHSRSTHGSRAPMACRDHVRPNRAGSGLTSRWPHIVRTLATHAKRIKYVFLECQPAGVIIDQQDSSQTLFYVDPPYVSRTRTSDAKYRHEMTDEDQVALINQLLSVQGKVALSGYDSDLYNDLLSGWRRETIQTTAFMSKSPRTEVLWISPDY